MRGTVLRGDWLRLRRRGDRVWVRVRPYELLWRTTHTFAVDDVRLIEIEAIHPEQGRRRRVAIGNARTRRVKPAVTRLTIQYGTDKEVSLELNETGAAVVGVFQDLADRVATEGARRQGPNAGQGLLFQQEDDDVEPIRLSPAPGSGRNSDLERDLFSLRESGDRVTPDCAWDVLFMPDPAESLAPSQLMPTDIWLFPQDEPAVEARQGVWIRKRRSRAPRLFRRRASS